MSLNKLGRYDIIRVLGKGAMGLVYEARDPNLDRRVAIKTIKVENLSEEAAAEYEARFRTEAHSAARLQHPHIVSVYDSDRHGDMAFLVMEFIQGEDLKHHLDAGRRYSLEETLRMVRELLSALDYAHRQNIVHRDVKPANLLIEADGRVKLTDFGVARIQDSGEATRTQGTMVGTLKYMSPEQVQGLPIDARADLFAVGVVLYQLLTGKRPFDGDTDFAIIQQIVGHTPAAPSSFNTLLPAAIDAVMARALAKKRDQRFATAQEFSAALQEASGHASDPTIVPPVSPSGGRAGTATDTGRSRAGGSTVKLSTNGTDTGSTVTQELELVYWKDIKDSEDQEDLEGFLDRFPSGIYADLARRRLRKLGGTVEADGSGTGSGPTPTGAFSEEVSEWTRLQVLNTRAAPIPATDTRADPAASAPAGPDAEGPDETWGVAPTVPLASPAPGSAAASTIAPPPMGAPVASGEAGTPAPPVRRSRMPLFALAGVAVLVLAGMVFKGLSGEPVPVVAAPADAALPATSAGAAPVSPAARSPEPALSVKAGAAPAAVHPAPKRATPVRTDKPAAAGPDAGTGAAKAAAAPVPAAVPAQPSSPAQACEGRMLLGYQICMNEQCAKPAYSRHPVCVERRAMEKLRREAQDQRN
ncbi:MAG: serine/threonine-protein kinase [Polaromonas sp.]|uniref:serine/threonine-protein kinase n=1 Tax=Polaromonas sp. TaxID=1869339 RepID=UPI00272F2311|nr:serine/threonine-protein kinase [Polaromonas sp.]MDP2450545.1 serine/threonine-protein kinase [Polaromonas sp.]MDP3250002.1 serine/threonine-protein kinase [Polaromonas sp.]MDP3757307.1 serine/threonine-protein kinase [Polaromonas sp.]